MPGPTMTGVREWTFIYGNHETSANTECQKRKALRITA
jgi:hypothetical protein